MGMEIVQNVKQIIFVKVAIMGLMEDYIEPIKIKHNVMNVIFNIVCIAINLNNVLSAK